MKLLIFSLIFSSICFGQNTFSIERQLTDFKLSLQQQDVDTFLVYFRPCPGGARPDTCNHFDVHYLFWRQDGATYFRRFDGCGTYQTIVLDTLNPLEYYLKYKKQIDVETIKIPTYIQSRRGNTQTAVSLTVDHCCFDELTFYLKGKRTFKSSSDFDLNFEKFDNGKVNMYYKYNQNTKLKGLVDQLKEFSKSAKFIL